jgi:membrane protein insertase Oxa1/YidC/SpoIIIJ
VGSSAILTEENINTVLEYLKSSDYSHLAAQLAPASAFNMVQINLLLFHPTLLLPNSFANLITYANGLFILPLLAGGSQLLMTSLMNGKKTKEQKEMEAAQQGQNQSNPMNSPIMKWFFPILSVWICGSSNAAFSIYWMAANAIQIVQQLAVNWYFDRHDAREAAALNPADTENR